ncbi:MAG: Stp1/IreP family PP2C-type Ser/Thr phosphatase [Candidatus Aminicenantes bacterium]|nr:MAG: Stp1/IreP family PP2C-type Ser/Thr phosphatase [Candidatus Aminicenantes bacterium]
MKLVKKLMEISQKEAMQKMVYGATDVGKERTVNEDFFSMNREKNLFIVADGMGGHNAGDVASRNAAQMADDYMTIELINEIQGDNRKVREAVIKSLIHAHLKILEMADKNPRYQGMGCTIVEALILGDCLHLCHVGDARAYVCNEKGIVLLTRDHSFVMDLVQKGKLTMEEARLSPMKNKLHQAIGASKTINPDYKHYILKDNDKILLCSDGLWDMMSDDQIYTVLMQDKPVKKLGETLIKMANNAGGHDNITAIIIQHKEQGICPPSQAAENYKVPEKTGEYSFSFDRVPTSEIIKPD